jgi:hypothetical protein
MIGSYDKIGHQFLGDVMKVVMLLSTVYILVGSHSAIADPIDSYITVVDQVPCPPTHNTVHKVIKKSPVESVIHHTDAKAFLYKVHHAKVVKPVYCSASHVEEASAGGAGGGGEASDTPTVETFEKVMPATAEPTLTNTVPYVPYDFPDSEGGSGSGGGGSSGSDYPYPDFPPPPPIYPIGWFPYTPPPIVSSAPEPKTWALLIIGIGFMGMMLRRSKKFEE